jgi:hypothetical protein
LVWVERDQDTGREIFELPSRAASDPFIYIEQRFGAGILIDEIASLPIGYNIFYKLADFGVASIRKGAEVVTFALITCTYGSVTITTKTLFFYLSFSKEIYLELFNIDDVFHTFQFPLSGRRL